MGVNIGLGIYEYNFQPKLRMGGYAARYKRSKGTHDPISCRTILIQSANQKIMLISGDFLGLIKSRVEVLKNQISEKYMLPIDNILISVIHTHSSILNLELFAKPSKGVLEIIDEGILRSVDNAFDHQFFCLPKDV